VLKLSAVMIIVNSLQDLIRPYLEDIIRQAADLLTLLGRGAERVNKDKSNQSVEYVVCDLANRPLEPSRNAHGCYNTKLAEELQVSAD